MSEESKYGLGNGITITTGFDVATQLPLDARTVVQTLDDLANIPNDYRYEGLLVFVIDGEDGNKLYQWKKNLDENGNLSDNYSWGPIESEISSKEVLDLLEIDFDNTQSFLMQKNKKDFFPIVHETTVLVDSEGKTMVDKYQPKYDESLETEDKTITGSVNEINTKLEDTIADFKAEIEKTLQDLKDNIAKTQAEAEETIKKLQDDIKAKIEAFEKELDDKIALMDKEFADTMAEIDRQIASLKASIEEQIEQMLKDLDNSILSDDDVNNFMEQINANLAALDEIE